MAAASLLEIPKNRGSKRSSVGWFGWDLRQFHRNFGTKNVFRNVSVWIFFHAILWGVSGVVSPVFFFWGFDHKLPSYNEVGLGTKEFVQMFWCVMTPVKSCALTNAGKYTIKHRKPQNVNFSGSPWCFRTQIEVGISVLGCPRRFPNGLYLHWGYTLTHSFTILVHLSMPFSKNRIDFIKWVASQISST